MVDALRLITATKGAVDSLKLVKDYADEIKDIQKRGEFMRIIGDASLALAESQIRLAEQLTENSELKTEIDRLNKEIDKFKNPELQLEFKDGLYYQKDGDGLYCTHCYDSENKRIRVRRIRETYPGSGKYQCPHCQGVVQ